VSRDEARRALEMSVKRPRGMADRDFKSEGFFEYHLYTLDGRTTIKDNQTSSSLLLSAPTAGGETVHYYGAANYYRSQYGVPFLQTRRSASTWICATARRTGSGSRCPRQDPGTG